MAKKIRITVVFDILDDRVSKANDRSTLADDLYKIIESELVPMRPDETISIQIDDIPE